MAAELCTRLLVQTAALKPKYRSSQLRAGLSTVEPVTRNIGDIRPFLV
jgi:hypothetical protein